MGSRHKFTPLEYSHPPFHVLRLRCIKISRSDIYKTGQASRSLAVVRHSTEVLSNLMQAGFTDATVKHTIECS